MTEAEKYLNRIENPMLKTDIYTRKEVIDFAEIFAKKQVEQAINFTRCSLELKGKEAITFGRYCATRGYHKFEGYWVNKQKFPRDIEWIKEKYNKEIFDL